MRGTALLPQPTMECNCSEPSFGMRFSLPLLPDITEVQGGLGAYRKEMKFPLPLTRRNSRLQAVCCSCLALQCWSQAVKHAASPAVEWQLHFIGCNGNFSVMYSCSGSGALAAIGRATAVWGEGRQLLPSPSGVGTQPQGHGHCSACDKNNSHCFDYFF